MLEHSEWTAVELAAVQYAKSEAVLSDLVMSGVPHETWRASDEFRAAVLAMRDFCAALNAVTS